MTFSTVLHEIASASNRRAIRTVGLDEARRAALERFVPLRPQMLSVDGADNLLLGEGVISRENVPRFVNAAMDGFALRAEDVASVPARLDVVAAVMAGDRAIVGVGPGQAVRIMTGAPLPSGANAVVAIEDVPVHDDRSVLIERPVPLRANVRLPGEDVSVGDEVFGRGSALRPASLGVLSSLGLSQVLAVPVPAVGVLSTGDELVERGTAPRAGQIRDANRPALLAAIRRSGFAPIDLGIVPDDAAAIVSALSAAARSCDAIVVSAGVSTGDRDLVAEVVDQLSDGDYHHLSVRLRPGKPLLIGTLGHDTPVVGLPGNPVAAMVGFELFVRPGLRQMAGHSEIERPVATGSVDVAFARRRDGKVHVVPVHCVMAKDRVLHVTGWSAPGSHQLRSFASCNALAVVPECDEVRAGDEVLLLLLEELTMRGLVPLEPSEA